MFNASLRKKYEETFQILQAYQAALNEAAIVSISDLNGKIMYVNDKFIEISGYSSAELIGQTHNIINSRYHPDSFFREMWDTIAKGKHWRGEIRNKTKTGEFYWVDTVISPVFDKNGKLFQYLSVRNLITKQKENEEKLINIQNEIKKKKQQLKDAQKIAKTGSWYFNISENKLEWSDEVYNIFEIPKDTNITYEAFLGYVHPDDREMVDSSWKAAMKTNEYEIEHRIATPSGKKWVSERAVFELNNNNDVVTALGTVQDITEKKKTENILKESESLYRNLFDNSPFAIGLVDKESLRFLEVNKKAEQLYGYTTEEFKQLTLLDVRIKAEHENLLHQVRTGNYSKDLSIKTHKTKSGKEIKIEPSISEILYKGKKAYLISLTDVTEKLNIQQQLNRAKLSRQKEIIEAQEFSRTEIAMELHDNVNQLLAASRIYLKRIKSLSENDKEIMDAALDIIKAANDEIRQLSASLVTPILHNKSLAESIQQICTNLTLNGIATDIDIDPVHEALPVDLKVNIYRIIQEQSNNILKHAEASSTKISLKHLVDENEIRLEVSDNGKGFDLSEKRNGIGFNNIFYRAETYNGKAYIETGKDKGCKLIVDFVSPLSA